MHAAVKEARLASGRDHYIAYGFRENRRPFFLHGFWHVDQYPVAAPEVARGDDIDPFHHYVAVGKSCGYRPAPG